MVVCSGTRLLGISHPHPSRHITSSHVTATWRHTKNVMTTWINPTISKSRSLDPVWTCIWICDIWAIHKVACYYFVAFFCTKISSHLCPKIQKNLGKQPGLPRSSNDLDLTWDAKHGIFRSINPEVTQKSTLRMDMDNRKLRAIHKVTCDYFVACFLQQILSFVVQIPNFIFHPPQKPRQACNGRKPSQAKPSLA